MKLFTISLYGSNRPLNRLEFRLFQALAIVGLALATLIGGVVVLFIAAMFVS